MQNSVFECKLDPVQYVDLKNRLTEIIDTETDSLRFYNLGNNWRRRVEHFGRGQPYDPDGPMIV